MLRTGGSGKTLPLSTTVARRDIGVLSHISSDRTQMAVVSQRCTESDAEREQMWIVLVELFFWKCSATKSQKHY